VALLAPSPKLGERGEGLVQVIRRGEPVMHVVLDLAIGPAAQVELGHAVDGRADVDCRAVIERQALLAAREGPLSPPARAH
jgi:hypothetical protein